MREPATGRARRALALLALGLWAMGCPGDDAKSGDPVADGAPPPREDAEAFRTKAHRDSFRALVGTVGTVLADLDPVAAAAAGKGTLRVPALRRTDRNRVREAVLDALEEIEGIDGKRLVPTDAAIHRAVSFALLRARHELVRRPAMRRDPTTWSAVATDVLDEMERARMRGEALDDLAAQAIVSALAEQLRAGPGQLGAASVASVAAAREDLAALRGRLQALAVRRPALQTAAGEADDTLGQLESFLASVAEHLPQANAVSWEDPVPDARNATGVRRLPDRLPAAVLRKRLEMEESLVLEPRVLAADTTLLLRRLDTMRKRLAPTPGPDPDPDPDPDPAGAADGGTADADLAVARPVDAARCEAAFAPLSAWAQRTKALRVTGSPCVPWLAGEPVPALDDGALTMAVFDLGIVGPMQAQRLATAPELLALVRGRLSPPGQAHALAVSSLSVFGAPAARVALDRSEHDLCLALTAVVLHGELVPDEAGARERLARDCPRQDPDDLIAAALARPRAATRALGMLHLGRGPADAVALSRFWWAPAGLVMPLATAGRPARAPRPGPAPAVEPLRPGRSGAGP